MEDIITRYEKRDGELVTISHYGGHDPLYTVEFEFGGKFENVDAVWVIQYLAAQLKGLTSAIRVLSKL